MTSLFSTHRPVSHPPMAPRDSQDPAEIRPTNMTAGAQTHFACHCLGGPLFPEKKASQGGRVSSRHLARGPVPPVDPLQPPLGGWRASGRNRFVKAEGRTYLNDP